MLEILKKRHSGWQEERRFVLGRLASTTLAEDFSPPPGFSARPRHQKYEALAKARLSSFLNLDDEVVHDRLAVSSRQTRSRFLARRDAYREMVKDHAGIEHGFNVTARILARAPGEYRAFCSRIGREGNPNIEELEVILRRPESQDNAMTFLAKMPQDRNDEWENRLNLNTLKPSTRPYSVTADHFPRFAIIQSGDEDAYFGVLINPRIAMVYRNGEDGPRGCKAAEVFLPKLWHQMITDCVTTPELFPADLAPLEEAA